MKRRHTMIRRCRQYGPDGESVAKTERVDVVIEWPDPAANQQSPSWMNRTESIYYDVGDWTLVDSGEPEADHA